MFIKYETEERRTDADGKESNKLFTSEHILEVQGDEEDIRREIKNLLNINWKCHMKLK